MITSTKNTQVPKNDGNLFEQMQQKLQGHTGQALFNLNKTMRNMGMHLNNSNEYITSGKRVRDGRNSFFSPQESRSMGYGIFSPHNRVGSMDVPHGKPMFPVELPPIGNLIMEPSNQ